jgi:replicative DNA helicase
MARAASGSDFTLDKALPNNTDAERLILGAILLDNSTVNQAAERLKREDFFLDSHRRIYEKMLYLTEQGRAIDPVTLEEELRRAGDLDLIGGPASIAALFDGVPRFSNIDNYTTIVKGKSILRRLITTSNQIMATCFDAEEEPEEILDQAERAILAIAEDRIRQGFVPISEVAHKQLEYIEEIAGREQLITGIATGFRDLDYMTSGLQRGDLVIIAARPSIGKCLSADSEIVLADGSVATIEEIYCRGQAELLTLQDDWKFAPTQPSAFVDDGVKPVYRVTTRLGRSVESTLSHPFLTVDGWRKLSELRVGMRIAVPRRIAVFGKERLRDGEVKLLGYLIGDGCLTKTSPEFTNSNPVLQEDFAEAVAEFPGLKVRVETQAHRTPSLYVVGDREFIIARRMDFARALRSLIQSRPRGTSRKLACALEVCPSLVYQWMAGVCVPDQGQLDQLCDLLGVELATLAPDGLTTVRPQSQNGLTVWLQKIGLWGKGAHQKIVPPIVFRLERSQIALFLNRLFATDGWVSIPASGTAQIGYATVSERLARQVQHLLLRFGVIARLRKRMVKYTGELRPSWQLDITHADAVRAFAAEIGVFGKETKLVRAVETFSREQTRNNRDLIPTGVWEEIARAKGPEAWSALARRAGLKGHTNVHVGQRALSRQRLSALAQALSHEHLGALATSDIYWDEIVSIEPLGEKQVYDLTIPETHNFVANDICVHNTAFSLNIAQNAALRPQHHGERAIVGIFSLEMSKEQLVQRMLCSQARVDAHRLRTGMLSKEDWRRLALAVSELAEARIFIDDTPAISVLEMRAKARRLKNEQRRLDLLIVDYLQLMTGRGRIESRQQEVSQISRELKGLAKELHAPVIALSQLSRATETRTDHRPQLSDLRECITGETVLIDAETGGRYTVIELFRRNRPASVFTLDPSLQVVRSAPATIIPSGEKDVFRLRTASGREVRASANHPFLTIEGWRRLDELKPGIEIATPRSYPTIRNGSPLHPDRARLLGYLVSDGSYIQNRAVSFISSDPATLEDARRICGEQFGFEPRDKSHWSGTPQIEFSVRGQYGPGRNPLVNWLRETGIHGQKTSNKCAPECIFTSPPEIIAEFLAGLYSGDGSIVRSASCFSIKYTSTSRRLLQEVQSLLLRLGVIAVLGAPTRHTKSTIDIADLRINGREQIAAFSASVPLIGRKGGRLQEAGHWARSGNSKAQYDRLPLAVTSKIALHGREQGLSWSQLGYRCQGKRIGRERLSKVAAVLGDNDLTRLATSDIYWDSIVQIVPAGREMTYDLMVPGTHNFIANDIILHNSGSLEQDSDVVLFIYRDEVYNPETEKQNIAEIIIGKQRNGPVGKVELVFQKALTRFDDKAYE